MLMRYDLVGSARRLTPVMGLALALTLVGAKTATAQAPQPNIANIEQRSGLFTRFVAIEPHLPPDPRRDNWYDTRWGDSPNMRKHPNTIPNGGLFGLRWRAKDTMSIPPSFLGSGGKSTLTPESKPPHWALRGITPWFHPFKPVGMYYEQGSYVPVYDLDPFSPGPGSWPWPFYISPTHWGG